MASDSDSTARRPALRIFSSGDGNSTLVYIDGEAEPAKMRLRSILLQAGELNVAWLEVEGVELDVRAEQALDGPPEAPAMLRLERLLRSLEKHFEQLEARVIQIESCPGVEGDI